MVSQGKELNFPCPLCNDHKSRMFLNRHTFLWQCHNCDERGNLYGFLERVLDLDPIEVHRIVRDLDYHFVPPRAGKVDEAKVELPEGLIPLRNLSSPIERPFWEYLMGPTRNLTPREVVDYHMQACLIGRYAMRVIIPMYYQNKLVSFAARSIYDACPCGQKDPATYKPKCEHKFVKILYPQGPHKSGILFNMDKVIGNDEVVLVEGPFDAIRLRNRAVATLGATLSAEQRQLLHTHKFERVIICYDPDEAGQKGANRALRELRAAGFDAAIAVLPPGTDPAMAPSQTLTSALAKAIPNPVLFSTTESKKELNMPKGFFSG